MANKPLVLYTHIYTYTHIHDIVRTQTHMPYSCIIHNVMLYKHWSASVFSTSVVHALRDSAPVMHDSLLGVARCLVIKNG